MTDDVRFEIEPDEDPNVVVRQLIEGLLTGLQAVGMERANAAQLMVVQGCIRLDELADLEEMQRYVNREVADRQEETEDDGEEAADAGNAIQH
jgi:hypothetical protein